MQELDLATFAFERVLAVGAHPDDVEFNAAGTLARLVDSGVEVTLVVCTDGGRGGRGIDQIVQVRHAEQERAAKEIGVSLVLRLGGRDGELVCDDPLRAELVRAIRTTRPNLVLTHDPATLWRRFGTRTFLGHTDHRATGQAVLDAVYPRAGNPNFFPEQLDAPDATLWEPGHLWLFDTARPDGRVPIEPTLDRKLAALRHHESQQGSAGGLVTAAERMAHDLGEGGVPAEAFQIHRLRRA